MKRDDAFDPRNDPCGEEFLPLSPSRRHAPYPVKPGRLGDTVEPSDEEDLAIYGWLLVFVPHDCHDATITLVPVDNTLFVPLTIPLPPAWFGVLPYQVRRVLKTNTHPRIVIHTVE